MKKYDVAIIGAGTAGLSARREVSKVTDNYIVIDDGPLGTTCARVGCMPSKVLIQVANDFDHRHQFKEMGILGAEHLRADGPSVMRHVRKLRDRFVRGVTNDMESWQNTHLLRKRARFIDKKILSVGDKTIAAEKIIIATGSSTAIPQEWLQFKEFLSDSNDIFEWTDLPQRVAVIGLGVIGLELGQALNRLGVKVVGIGRGPSVGGLTDPEIQTYVIKKMGQEMELHFDGVDRLERSSHGIKVWSKDKFWEVDKALLALGRVPNIKGLGLENLELPLNKNGLPSFNINTGNIPGTSIYIAGDVNGDRPLLHEAADEGRIAGYNSVREKDECFRRRTPLSITFSDPNIAIVGRSFQSLTDQGIDFVTGKVSFEGQGRSIVKLKEKGLLHLYAERETGNLLGAELFAPDGEHLAHLISWMVELKQNVHDVLSLPFYHPVIEEGLRTALRDVARQTKDSISPLETVRCQEPPVEIKLSKVSGNGY